MTMKVDKVGLLLIAIAVIIAGIVIALSSLGPQARVSSTGDVGVCTKDNMVMLVFPANASNPHVRVVEIFDDGTIAHFIDPSPPIKCPTVRFEGS